MIREGLEREGLADNTVIIFTSDNGYNSDSHGFGDKVIPYEEGSKAPLLIYDPRLPQEHAGQVCESITANVDMAATIFALSGVHAPEGIDGKSLIPLLTNPTSQVREFLPLFNFWGTRSAQSLAVVTPEWKYIYWYYGGNGMRPTDELFHLGSDRIEMENVASHPEYSEQLAILQRHYDNELAHIKSKGVTGHGYESYPVLFDRSLSWAQRESLLKVTNVKGSEAEGAGGTKRNRKVAR